eukprot:377380-Rhodomonas_salina.1
MNSPYRLSQSDIRCLSTGFRIAPYAIAGQHFPQQHTLSRQRAMCTRQRAMCTWMHAMSDPSNSRRFKPGTDSAAYAISVPDIPGPLQDHTLGHYGSGEIKCITARLRYNVG